MQVDVKNSLSKSLFWDVNFEDIDSQTHSLFITERVLTRGTLDDFKVLKNYFGIEKLKSINSRNLVLAFKLMSFKFKESAKIL